MRQPIVAPWCRALLLSLFAYGSLAHGQVPTSWTSRGIGGGGSFYAPALSPFNDNEFFVSSDMSDLFHTTNFGLSYECVNQAQIQGGHFSVAQFTSSSNTLYSLTYTGGNNSSPVKSTDGGKTWSPLASNPLPWDECYSLWADWNNSQAAVLAGWASIYITTNGGNSFKSISLTQTNGTGGLVGGAFFDSTNIYLGTSEGLMVSKNGGASFVNQGTPGIPAGEYIRSFAGAKVGGQMRFFVLTVASAYAGQDVGADYWGNFRGIYSMDNATGPWVRRAGGIDLASDFLMFIAMARNDINTVYAGGSKSLSSGTVPGVMKTTDGGQTWTNLFNTVNNQNIVTGWSGQGGDRNWGYGEVVFGLAVAPSNSAKVVITDMGFVHKSTDGGQTWRQAYVNPADQHPAGSTSIANKSYHGIGLEDTSAWQILWNDPTNLFAAFTDIKGIRSTDGGNAWSFNYTGHSANTMYRAFIHPQTRAIYAATSDIHDMYQSTRLADAQLDSSDANGKIICSTDKGASWQLLHYFGHPVFWLSLDPNRSNTIYASVVHSTSGGVFVSTNIQAGSASTWTRLPAPARTEGHPACLNVLNDGKVLCTYSGRRTASGFTASSGVFLYDPIQKTWTDLSDPGMRYWTKDLVIDPADPAQNTWYVGVFSGWGGPPDGLGGLYRTTDRGAHWSKINTLDRVTSITFNPGNLSEAYLTTETSGLWHTDNIRAASPVFALVNSYPFRQPERVYFDPFDPSEIWVCSFGYGMAVGRSAAPAQTVQFATDSWSASETAGSIGLTVTRTGTNGAASVNYSTTNGSATSPANYTSASGTLSWPDGDGSSRTLTIPIKYAAGYAGNLSFGVTLSNPIGAALGVSVATVTITETDVPPARTNFNLVVANGSGSGVYQAGATVGISANPAPAGFGFDRWTGATVADPLSPNTTFVMPASDTAVTATYKWMSAGTTYEVGPSQTYSNLSSVPWTSLQPNDIVNVHYKPGGYHEIVLLSNSGASNAPITIHGVPDPVTGALPVLDGSNAVAAASIPWRSPVFDTLGVVVISRYMGTAWGYIPSWITIENLHIQNADRGIPMTPSTGTPTKYSSFACGIYVEFAQHLTIRNCEINGAENGFFCNSKDSSPEELSGDILIENCYIHHNGYLNDYGVHNLYTEAMGITLQNNLIGPLRAGACGEQWKNRSAGTRIRYNQWIMGPGPGTCMWLESPQGGQGVIDLDPSYKTNWCYGNVIYNPTNSTGSTMIRFDALGIEGVPRSGTLFFYNNTVVNHANQSARWSSAVFDLPRHDEVLSTGIHDVLDCRNNIIANFSATAGSAPSTLYMLTSDDGNIDFGTNWISAGTQWFVLPYLKTNFYGTFTGTNQLIFGNSQNNPGFMDLASINLHLMSNSVCIDMAGPKSPQIAGTPDDITQEYVFPTGGKARAAVGAALDLGAFEGNSTNTPPPPSPGAPPNYPPVAVSQSVNVTENSPALITLTGHDADNDPLSFAVVTTPAKGTLSGTAPNLTFTPTANATGPDWFAFTVNDGKVTSPPAIVQIGINGPTNTPPTVSLLTPSTHSWFVAPTNVLLSATITAPDGVKRVDFFDGTNNIGSASNAPYAFIWTNPVPGIHTLFAKGFANSGARTFSSPAVITVLKSSPQLSIQQSGGQSLLALPVDGWLLEESTNVTRGWTLSPVAPGGVQSQISNTNHQKFFRLVLPW